MRSNSTPANIAIIINNLGIGGAERVFVNDANMFARRGYKVVFFMLYGGANAQKIAGELDAAVEQHFVCAAGPFDLAAALRIVRVMRERQARILISTLNDANIIARWCVMLSARRIRLYIREANDPAKKPAWQRVLDILFDSFARKIIAVTEQVRQGIVRDAPWREKKVIALHNAVDVPANVAPRGHDGPVRILTVGSLTEQKDHATLIDALAELKQEGVRFEAKIIGGGPLEQALKRQAAGAGLSQVVFPGKLFHDDTLREYAAADIFVLSSRWEGCPNVVLEAMAYGLPVVATNVGGVPELVEDGVSGMLVAAGDPKVLATALRNVIEDAARRSALGSAGRSRVTRDFTREARFAKLKNILRLA